MIETAWYWGIVAQPKSGKTTLGEAAQQALAEIGLIAVVINFSDPMGEALKALRHITDPQRPEYQRASRGFRHADSFGEDVWGREIEFRALEAATAGAQLVSLAGIRRQEEVDIVRRLPRPHTTYLTAPFVKRLELTNIGRARKGLPPMTAEQFAAEDADECEIHIAEIGPQCDSFITNGGTLAELHHTVRLLLRDHCGFPIRV